MGVEVTFTCSHCGYRLRLSSGCGFLGSPWEPKTRKDVLNGVYRSRPKKVLEANPDSACGCYSALFHCSCGNYVSKSAVFIRNGEKLLYKPSKRCSICNKKMWEVESLPDYAPCPKCGTIMEESEHILWD